MPTAAVIVAAGSGTRMGDDDTTPKQLRLLGGRPVIAWSLEFFDALDCIDAICIVTRHEWRATMVEAGLVESLTTPIFWAEGGYRRQDSSRNGVEALPKAYGIVAIHDAARPFPSKSATEDAVEIARAEGGSMVAAPMIDTVKRADSDSRIVDTVDRSDLWLAQTPQVFQRALLLEAFERAQAEGRHITDDASALEVIGRPPRIVSGSPYNLKITTVDDLARAEAFVRAGLVGR